MPVLITGAIASTGLLAIAIKKLDHDKIPPAAVLAAAFFVSSLVSVPAGPSSVHLILNGVMGILLGWTALPAILVALLMQSLFFGHGGLLTLGVNTFNIALPALLVGWFFRPRIVNATPKQIGIMGSVAGGLSVLMTAILIYLSLTVTGQEYQVSGKIIAVTYLPLMIVEALISGVILSFLMKVSPDLLKS
ncbi:cobalt transporter CbiM [Litoribrevibacter albus]|uniref:Cobalt transporter CbiM n=2 Tax=Litoribrevibacter albus TaxID=1473156 RepID=A0AA37W7T6_9GAMM|nr:cobalt transporter CbiM [Litoribrevibacter albus]